MFEPCPQRNMHAFFLHPSFLPPSVDIFFRIFPTTPPESVRVIVDHLLGSTNTNIQKSYKDYLQNTLHMVLRNRPTLSISQEKASPPHPLKVWGLL